MTQSTVSREDHRSSADIQEDIRQTRGRMDATLDELGNRLTVRSIFNTAMDWWDSPQPGAQGSAAASSVAKAVARQVKHHPMPSLLIGSGIAWLISEAMDHDGDSHERPGRYYPGPRAVHPDAAYGGYQPVPTPHEEHEGPGVMDKMKGGASGAFHSASDAASGAVDATKEKLSAMGGSMHHSAEHFGEWAHGNYDRSRTAARKLKSDLKEGYHRGAERFEDAVEEYPLAVGVAFAALGALAGLVIPRTRREDEFIGERSDQLVEAAKEKGAELLEGGKAVGHRVMEAVKEEAAEQGLTPGAVGEKISELAEKGGEVVKKAREEAAHAAEDEGIKPKEPKKQPDLPESPFPPGFKSTP